MDIEYTIHIWKEENQFIAHAMPLDVISSGQTSDQAKKALFEAVDLFLNTAAEMGTLDEILQESGYHHHQQTWISPTWVSIERYSASMGT